MNFLDEGTLSVTGFDVGDVEGGEMGRGHGCCWCPVVPLPLFAQLNAAAKA